MSTNEFTTVQYLQQIAKVNADFVNKKSIKVRKDLIISQLIGFAEECLEYSDAITIKEEREELIDCVVYCNLINCMDYSTFTIDPESACDITASFTPDPKQSLTKYLQFSKRLLRQSDMQWFVNLKETANYLTSKYLSEQSMTSEDARLQLFSKAYDKVTKRNQAKTLFNKGVD